MAGDGTTIPESPTFLSEVALVDALSKTPLIFFVAWHCGRLFSYGRLPKISGYLFAGVFAGSEGFGLLSSVATKRLWPVSIVCLALIGISAGSELSLTELRRKDFASLVLRLTAAISVCTWVFVFPVFLLIAPRVGFLAGAPRGRVLGVATLAATLGIARSPASMIAVLREMDGRGPFCSLVMSVTVVKDVLVLLLFAINVEIVASAEAKVDESSSVPPWLQTMLLPLYSIAISFIWGGLGGLMLGWACHPVVARAAKLPLLLGLAGCLFLWARAFHAEPLLVCVVAGAVAGNARGGRGEAQREELHGVLRRLQPWVNLAFFTTAGMSLAVRTLASSAPVALALHLVRLASLVAGCRLGGRGLPAELRRVCWMAMVTQAGVALGLARTVAARFPGWGNDFYALMVSTIVLNQAVGPPLFRYAITATGEAHVDRNPAQKGLESISLHELPSEVDRKL